jgi:hypothetical protein
MPSLLDFLMQGRSPTAGGLLQERARARGLLDGVETPPPDLFNPGDPASLPQLQGSAGVQHGAPPQMPQPPQAPQGVPQPQVQMQDSARQQAAQGLAQLISGVTGGKLPERSIDWIDEASKEAQSGPGERGHGILARLYLGNVPEGLSSEQVTRLRREAMITAGLTMMAQPWGVTTSQAFARGILAARMGATESMGALMDEQAAQAQVEQAYAVLNNPGMTDLQRYMEIQRRAMAEGNLEAAKVAGAIIKDLRELSVSEAAARYQNINGGTFLVDPDGTVRDPFSKEVVSQAPPAGSKLVSVNTPAGPMTYREGPDGSLYDAFTGVLVQHAPQARPEAPDLDSTRLGQLSQETRQFRTQERGLANILADVASIKSKLEETGTVSSVDQRALAARLSQALEAGNLRESSIQAISGSGGLAGIVESALGQLKDGAASATVARDLIQAIERSGNQARRELERERGDIRRRLEVVRGITPDEVAAELGTSPFGAPSDPEPEEEEANPFDAAFKARRGQVQR